MLPISVSKGAMGPRRAWGGPGISVGPAKIDSIPVADEKVEEAATEEAEEKSLEELEELEEYDALDDCKTGAAEEVEDDCVEAARLEDVEDVVKELEEVTDDAEDNEAAVDMAEDVEDELEDEGGGTTTGGRFAIQTALQDVFLAFLIPTARFM
jgi:uncharacterized protein (DUF885 family)